MKPSVAKLILGVVFIVLGLIIGAAGIYIAETDDAPGAALIAVVVMVARPWCWVQESARRK